MNDSKPTGEEKNVPEYEAHQTSRRRFIELGVAAAGASLLTTTRAGAKETSPSSSPKRIAPGIDLEKWNRIKGEPYELGEFGKMPGVCKLPGPKSKRNWPDREKYKGVKKIHGHVPTLQHGMRHCRLCERRSADQDRGQPK